MQLLNSLTEWLAGFKQVSLKRILHSDLLPTEKEETTLLSLDITHTQIHTLQKALIDSFTTALTESHIADRMMQWQKLYENFRIGLQLGFQNFQETVNESGEPIQEKKNSQEFNSEIWEKLSIQLLSQFDQDCAHEMQEAAQTPEAFITPPLIFHWLETAHQKFKTTGTTLLKHTIPLAEQLITQQITALNQYLHMDATLKKLMADPGIIAVNFEMYLWARYIKENHIGGYSGKLKGLLQITPRIAPRAPVVQRLADLRVIDSHLLEKTTPKNADSHLKKLNEWAQTQTSRLNLWEDIRDEGHKSPPV